MKLRIYFRDRKDAITPIISAVLAVMIILGAALSAIFWGFPYINKLRSEESLESAETQFNLIVDKIKDIVTGKVDDKYVLSLSVEEGSISIDNNDYDRTILMYSYFDTQNFSISELGDRDNDFELMIHGTGSVDEVHVFPIKDNGELDEEIPSTFDDLTIKLINPGDFFEDKMVIFLNNSDDTVI
jgi:hypothetical protein